MLESTPCGLCMRLIDTVTLPDSGGFPKTLEWHPQTKDVVKSKQSCPPCDAIWKLLLAPSLSAAVDRFEDITHDTCLGVTLKAFNNAASGRRREIKWSSLTVSLEIPQHGFSYFLDGTIGITVEVSPRNPDHRHPQFWISGRTRPHLQIAEDRILCAKAWLEDCEAGFHRECEPSAAYLPTRFIDVRPDQTLRLVSTDGLDQASRRPRYATLSHCWGRPGESEILKTNSATVGAHHKEIPQSSLPKTFRDAIRTTRSLGIPYLWIDSLCIVQDDVEDWQREAARMKDVYAGSTLTIAASDGLNSSWGCFPGSDGSLEPVADSSPVEESQRLDATAESVVADKKVRIFSFSRRDIKTGSSASLMVRFQSSHPREVCREAPLSTRGWVLQEQMLSHRTLHCLDSELHWQCRREYRTQSGQDLFEDGSEYGLDHHHGHSRTTPRDVKMWPQWIESYSWREFTVPSDRMPAFAGISDYYRSITGQPVVLGIRRDSLAKDLAWARAAPKRGLGGTRVPSWSWMSCDAPIWVDLWHFGEYEDLVQDHVSSRMCHVDWTGPPMTSPIQSTMFIIKGPVKQLTLRAAPEAKNFNPPYFLVGGGQKSDFSEHPVPWNCAGRFDDETHHGDVEVTYTCLLLRSRLHKTSRQVKETFLILAQTVEMVTLADDDVVECNGFRRVGIASIEGTERTFVDAEVKTLELF
ncbi:het domain protein [Colletotrichum sojae]|uniref:Het domain protein n=1 Tax=Colletotrichum sojae TaxID=2175907 RepID=A0A8H6J6S1_9PEZI|nr:het domain protein [Colletotrichum sojae]